MHNAPVKFRLVLQLAEKGDKLDDRLVAWSDSHKTLALGTVRLTRVIDDEAIDKALIFIPSAVPDGIQPADPMIDARSQAYPVSFSRRQR